LLIHVKYPDGWRCLTELGKAQALDSSDEERVRGDPRGSGIGVKIRIAVFAGVA
jgi:hypothetical protein